MAFNILSFGETKLWKDQFAPYVCDIVMINVYCALLLHPCVSVFSLTTEITFSTPELTDILKDFLCSICLTKVSSDEEVEMR